MTLRQLPCMRDFLKRVAHDVYWSHAYDFVRQIAYESECFSRAPQMSANLVAPVEEDVLLEGWIFLCSIEDEQVPARQLIDRFSEVKESPVLGYMARAQSGTAGGATICPNAWPFAGSLPVEVECDLEWFGGYRRSVKALESTTYRDDDGSYGFCSHAPDSLPADCIAYSLGVDKDLTFDWSFANARPHCRVFSIDASFLAWTSYCLLKSGRLGFATETFWLPNMRFVPLFVGNPEQEPPSDQPPGVRHRLAAIMRMLGHRRVHFMKIDCEGCELDETFWYDLVKVARPLSFALEVHGDFRTIWNATPQVWRRFFAYVRAHGYLRVYERHSVMTPPFPGSAYPQDFEHHARLCTTNVTYCNAFCELPAGRGMAYTELGFTHKQGVSYVVAGSPPVP
eukprot:gnl/TRDRNA2_/TRDRNA2_93968_c0_seq1.p1 gnl/TRDRNA2_/TRDRNA2_93968_c0~~gnl/TRDRNA2_/TRDRNA2_93968_c0_seq1.p1  ORF type:complete len:396 (-),score=45.49 gnl/TRDRNA2_/TRDRNA2_93968_c0_seq1:46-1233(-)